MRPPSGEAPAATAPRWLRAVVVGLVTLPLLAAVAGQLLAVGADYQAAGDLADIELHTRDVGDHPVEMGQYSRGDWAHPGPAQFYAFALPYRLTGSHSVGMNVGALLVNGLAVAGILLFCHRRGGAPLLWLAAVGCALLLRGFGPGFLIEPWNPSVPVLPFGLFLFLLWEIACGTAWAIPAAAAVGTFCAQTHIAYVPLVTPLAAVAVAALLGRVVREPADGSGPQARRSLLRATLVTVGVLGVMWLPPVLEELGPHEGNLTRAFDFFRDGEGEAHTLAQGYDTVAAQFAATPEWVTGNLALTPFSSEPDLARGAPFPVLAVPFLAGAVVWWRRRSAAGLALVGLTAVAAGLSIVTISRTIGPLFHYRLGWTRLIAMTAVLSAAWALWTVVAERWPRVERKALVPLSLAAVVVLAGIGVPRFARAGPPLETVSDDIDVLAPVLLGELPAGEGPVILRCDGDPSCIYLGGFVLWLERRGVDVQVDNPFGLIATGAPHRVYDGGPVRAVLHVSIDARFYARAARPEVEVVAHVGPEPTSERARIAQEILDLDAAYQVGALDARDYLSDRSSLSDQLGTGVGVVLEPFEA